MRTDKDTLPKKAMCSRTKNKVWLRTVTETLLQKPLWKIWNGTIGNGKQEILREK